MGARADVVYMEQRKIPCRCRESNPHQPARRNTDWATPCPSQFWYSTNYEVVDVNNNTNVWVESIEVLWKSAGVKSVVQTKGLQRVYQATTEKESCMFNKVPGMIILAPILRRK
jgi:hypothetical protein